TANPSHRPMGSSVPLFALAKNGERVPVDIELAPLRWQDQDCVMAVLRCRVTKLAKEEEQQKLLRENEERLRRSQSIARIGTWDWTLVNDRVVWSDEVYNILGLAKGGKAFSPAAAEQYMPPDDVEMLKAKIASALKNESTFEVEHRICRPDGKERFVQQVGEVYYNAKGRPVRVLGTIQDVTQEREYRSQQRLFQTIFEYANEGILSLDSNYRIMSVNPVVESLVGYNKASLIGRDASMLLPRGKRKQYVDEILEPLSRFGSWRGELDMQPLNAPAFPVLLSLAMVPDVEGGRHNMVATISDISKLKLNESQLDFLAHYDQLTRLPNRTLFLRELNKNIEQAAISGERLGLLYIDLDGFKQINDSQGHSAGDELLFEVAQQLRSCVNVDVLVSRLGGDEFAVLTPRHSNEPIEKLAEKIIQSLQLRKDFGDHSLAVSASVGIACYPEDGTGPLELIKKADQAMYEAKGNGKNSYQRYNRKMGDMLRYRLQLTSDLAKAIEQRHLCLYLQPKFNVDNPGFAEVEALLRWPHDRRGLVPPGDFIPLAEETGQILALGKQVIELVCEFVRQWRRATDESIKVAVNLSARQLHDKNLLADIASVLECYGVPASCLEFEITESVVMYDVDSSLRVFAGLKAMGSSIAIDDFGTGYSSLSYLKKLPVDTLKIDRSFIAPLPNSADDLAIVRAIISMAKSLNMNVVAEGVETHAQQQLLTELGCQQLQGFYFGRPIPVADFMRDTVFLDA
ncbi:MAG: EAL domain-containing protein, partial [Cellvibrionaceae bacterium]|nr:EAL domain-containing protein [Cellvibrionaceae bacterium]